MNSPPTPSDSEAPGGDPWAAFGYLVAGVVFYGAIGVGLSVWLDATYWIPIGILVGAGFGMYMVFARYRVHPPDTTPPSLSTPIDADAGSNEPPLRNDRGESS
ncbi:MAG: AtpZ/AtpI family protein [Pseudonocardiales bacterium]|nr:AtpZ/AtpI family protein [Pseudonocardiales bacterium]